MQPEISHRCVSCGAAVRAGARFCPQCGQGFDDDTGKEHARAAKSEGAFSSRESGARQAAMTSSRSRRGCSASLAGEDASPKTLTMEAGRDAGSQMRDVYQPALEEGRAAERESVEARGSAVGAATSSQGASGTGQGTTRAARVREEARARVENTKVRAAKMRDEALVALEETPDDSGLRFVVVAVVLFLLFLIFLFFSTSILR